MKTLALWLALHVALVAGTYAATRTIEPDPPQRIGIAIDASFPMKKDWPQVGETLRDIAATHEGALFLVVTQPGKTGTWAQRPSLDGARPFAPRKLNDLIAMPIWTEADRVYLVTNAHEDAVPQLAQQWETRAP